jgi:hypothetical protein
MLTLSAQVSACRSLSGQSSTDCHVVRDDVDNNSVWKAGSWTRNTKDALPTAGQWLHDCRLNHKACNREVDTDTNGSWYPTRLIYLGDTDRDVRLIKTAENPPSGPYMTLSHRWGTALFTKLLRSNLDSFCDSIPVADLRMIFQDAIFASRKLGVQYLWIDSLCIMQDKDDLTDWTREASLMSKVYSNSHCNLSASDTDKDVDTLFKHRDVQDLGPFHVRFCTIGFNEGADFVICELTHNELWKVNVSRCPIQNRGWVYQERVLAPRIIHFGRDQLFWECREQRLCEQYPHGLFRTISNHSGVNFKQSMDFERINLEWAHQDLYPDSLNRNDACFRIWATVVEEYSLTSLTNSTDKLIAISGIAKSFADVTGQTYVAGMWRENLEHALLWRNSDRKTYTVGGALFPQPNIWRAPSWSWASVDGPVEFVQHTGNHSLISVQDLVLTHATEDAMGLLTGGWLDLRGALKPMHISYDCNNTRWAHGWSITDLGMPDESTLEHNKLLFLDFRYYGPSGFGDDRTEVDLFYIPVSRPEHRTVDLFLLRLTDRHGLLFERVGMGQVWGLDQKNLNALLKNDTSEKKKESLPNLEYLDEDTHLIRIV